MDDVITPGGWVPASPPGYRDAVLCGAGATSRVFRATDVSSGRVVALKRLHRSLTRSGSTHGGCRACSSGCRGRSSPA